MCHLFKNYTPLHVVDVVSGGDGGGDDDGGGISGFVVVAVPGVVGGGVDCVCWESFVLMI